MHNKNGTLNRVQRIQAVRVDVKMNPELYQLIAACADREAIGLSEFIVRVAAEHFRRPDLAKIPRKRMGRPRKELAAQAS